jgi:hypothetical protein
VQQILSLVSFLVNYVVGGENGEDVVTRGVWGSGRVEGFIGWDLLPEHAAALL